MVVCSYMQYMVHQMYIQAHACGHVHGYEIQAYIDMSTFLLLVHMASSEYIILWSIYIHTHCKGISGMH